MARNYVSELTAVREAINDCIANGGLVNIRIGDQSYTLGMGELRTRERKLENLIRIRNGGGRSIIGEVTL